MYYVMYSWDKLIYATHKNLRKCKFNTPAPRKFGKFSFTSNPIQISDNTYTVMLHKKLESGRTHMHYMFYLARFDIHDGVISNKRLKRVNIPTKSYYALSLCKTIDNKIRVLCGHHDCQSAHVVIDHEELFSHD